MKEWPCSESLWTLAHVCEVLQQVTKETSTLIMLQIILPIYVFLSFAEYTPNKLFVRLTSDEVMWGQQNAHHPYQEAASCPERMSNNNNNYYCRFLQSKCALDKLIRRVFQPTNPIHYCHIFGAEVFFFKETAWENTHLYMSSVFHHEESQLWRHRPKQRRRTQTAVPWLCLTALLRTTLTPQRFSPCIY